MGHLIRVILIMLFWIPVAEAATAFIETPPTWTDNTALVQCDASGEPAPWCIRERRIYTSQVSASEVAPTPQPSARMEVVALTWTTWCVDNVTRNTVIYSSQAVVKWDNTVVVSLANFFLPGNLVAWEQGFIDTAVVDGLDLMKLRSLFGSIRTRPVMTVADCPQNSGVNFTIYPRDDIEYADLNHDGIVDMLDIMIMRVILFGLATL